MQAIPLNGGVTVIDHGPTCTLAITDGDDVVLMDCGLDASAGKKIDKVLEGRRVSAVYLTHSHADHMGASAHFAKKHGAVVHVPAAELSFVRQPSIESGLLYGGSSFPAVRSRFLCAEAVPGARPLVVGLANDAGFRIGEHVVTPVDLSGHSPAQTGYLVDDVFFVGDALFSTDIVDKYRVLYLYDPEAHLAALDRLTGVPCGTVVFCHRGVVSPDEAAELAQENRAHVENIRQAILNEIDGGTAEALARRIMKKLGVPDSMELILLVTSTVKGYLAWLARQGLVEASSGDAGIHWSTPA